MSVSPRPFWQSFLFFVLPLMAANILQALSGTINNIFLGQLLGVKALAAASVFFPILFLFIAFLIGLSAGATVLIGQAWGARNHERVKAVTGSVLTVALAGGLVIGILASINAHHLMRLLGTPDDIFADAVAYARVSFLSMPLAFLFFTASGLLRGVGDTVTPLYSLLLSTLVSAVMTPALILGWFGLPQLGIVSAAVAGFFGFAASLVLLFFYLRWRKHPMAPDRALLRHLRPDGAILRLVVRIGVPTGVQVVSGAIAGIVIVGMVNKFGSNATAAYGAVNQILSFVQFPAISVGIAASVFGAQYIGAGRMSELGRVTRTALMMNLLLTGTLILLAYLGADYVIGWFITQPDTVELAKTLLHIVLWSCLMFGASAVLSGIMRSSGEVMVPMLIQVLCIAAVELPVAFWLSARIGITGIWWGFVASFAAMMVLQFLWYQLVWRRRTITAMI